MLDISCNWFAWFCKYICIFGDQFLHSFWKCSSSTNRNLWFWLQLDSKLIVLHSCTKMCQWIHISLQFICNLGMCALQICAYSCIWGQVWLATCTLWKHRCRAFVAFYASKLPPRGKRHCGTINAVLQICCWKPSWKLLHKCRVCRVIRPTNYMDGFNYL